MSKKFKMSYLAKIDVYYVPLQAAQAVQLPNDVSFAQCARKKEGGANAGWRCAFFCLCFVGGGWARRRRREGRSGRTKRSLTESAPIDREIERQTAAQTSGDNLKEKRDRKRKEMNGMVSSIKN
jgi:hypothetical protein